MGKDSTSKTSLSLVLCLSLSLFSFSLPLYHFLFLFPSTPFELISSRILSQQRIWLSVLVRKLRFGLRTLVVEVANSFDAIVRSSASEFIELFVGVGASRVRDIFKQAKEKAPAVEIERSLQGLPGACCEKPCKIRHLLASRLRASSSSMRSMPLDASEVHSRTCLVGLSLWTFLWTLPSFGPIFI